MTRPLSLAALTVLELAPPDRVSCAAEAGFPHVGLRLIPATAGEPVWPVIGDTPMVREIARRLADTGTGMLDLAGLLRALPPELPVGLEIPMHTLALTVSAAERARRMRAKTRALLATA